MKNLGVKEAAAEIRDSIAADHVQRVDPEQAHQLKFVAAVCEELGLDPTAENVHHVMVVLREHDVALHSGNEYPKYVTRKYDNTSHIVQNADEADAVINAEKPEPVNQPRIFADQGEGSRITDFDLSSKVPHVVPTDHGPGRAPDEQTNRAASQDPSLFRSDNRAVHDQAFKPTPLHELAVADEVDADLHVDDAQAHIEEFDPTDAESSAPLPDPAPRRPVGERKRPE